MSQQSNTELMPEQIIIGERNYDLALDTLIASAKRELLIFDESLAKGDYKSLQRYELLRGFLAENAQSRLTMVLHDTSFFTEHCPHLYKLLATFSHKFTVYQTNEEAKVAKDCFIIADQRDYLRRFHIDQPRFKFSLDDQETVTMLNMRFDELLQATTHSISPTYLGL